MTLRTVDVRKVIVGQEYHRTPMFSDNISYSEFNPTWTVSRSIAGNEVLPKLRKDPNYLAKIGYEIHTSWKADAPAMNAESIDWSSVSPKNFPYRIVQPAGPDNVLGQVKFVFPNRFNVCIRVEKPLEFADLLYRMDGTLSPQQIRQLVASGKTTQAKFRRPIPVHLGYFTLWIGDDGKLSSYADAYGRDKLIEKIIFGGA